MMRTSEPTRTSAHNDVTAEDVGTQRRRGCRHIGAKALADSEDVVADAKEAGESVDKTKTKTATTAALNPVRGR